MPRTIWFAPRKQPTSLTTTPAGKASGSSLMTRATSPAWALTTNQSKATPGSSGEVVKAVSPKIARFEARAIQRLLNPRSVAIVGASGTPGALGASTIANLDRMGFAGEIHLVNP